MKLIHSPYFFHGSPDHKQYGLYDVIVDRLVIVHRSLRTMKLLQIVLSSKYNLILFEIDGAANQIDNTCCFNWSMEHDIPVDNRPGDHLLDGCRYGKLIELGPIDENETIIKDQHYMLFCAVIICRLDDIDKSQKEAAGRFKAHSRKVAAYIAQNTGMIFPTGDPNILMPAEILRETYQILYLADSIDEAESKLHESVLEWQN